MAFVLRDPFFDLPYHFWHIYYIDILVHPFVTELPPGISFFFFFFFWNGWHTLWWFPLYCRLFRSFSAFRSLAMEKSVAHLIPGKTISAYKAICKLYWLLTQLLSTHLIWLLLNLQNWWKSHIFILRYLFRSREKFLKFFFLLLSWRFERTNFWEYKLWQYAIKEEHTIQKKKTEKVNCDKQKSVFWVCVCASNCKHIRRQKKTSVRLGCIA